MTRDEALASLAEITSRLQIDPERDHIDADRVLLDLIGDVEITDAFDKIGKWYS